MDSGTLALPSLSDLSHPGMIRISSGAYQMGSDRHYPEETPVHRVTVDGFWIDRAPVTNRDFRRMRAEIVARFVELGKRKPLKRRVGRGS